MDMRRNMVIASVAIVPCIGFLFIRHKPEASDVVAEAVLASPTTAEIRTVLQGKLPLLKGEKPEEAKRRIYVDMFKKRFRRFEPAIAIGMRFETPQKVRIYFPARLEPYYRDRVAYAAWKELKEVFGTPPEVTIWDTYIGLAPILAGRLEVEKSHPDGIHITHIFSSQHYGR
mgnify:CR=1 FL=1